MRRVIGLAAMAELGCDAVEPDELHGPSPGRIADWVADVHMELETALGIAPDVDLQEATTGTAAEQHDTNGALAKGRLTEAVASLGRIVSALDTWGAVMLKRWDAEQRGHRRSAGDPSDKTNAEVTR
jgi:hypothetical protein